MHKNLINILRIYVNIFNLLRHDVLSLTQLEDMFLTIDNFQRSIAQPLTNVAGVMPTLSINRLTSSFGIAEITKESKFSNLFK